MKKLLKKPTLLITFIFILVSLTACMNPEELLKETESDQKIVITETQSTIEETEETQTISEEQTQESETESIIETEETTKIVVDLNNYINDNWGVDSTSGGKLFTAKLTFIETLESEVTFEYEITYQTGDAQGSQTVLVDDCSGSIDGNLVHYNFVDSYGNIGRGQLTLLDGKIQITSTITQRNARAEYDAAIDATLIPVVIEEKESDELNSDDFILPDSNTRLLTEEDLNDLSYEDLELGRNEIYARKGRIFEQTEWIEYFSNYSWYHPSIEGSEFDSRKNELLNEYEKSNLTLIESYMSN